MKEGNKTPEKIEKTDPSSQSNNPKSTANNSIISNAEDEFNPRFEDEDELNNLKDESISTSYASIYQKFKGIKSETSLKETHSFSTNKPQDNKKDDDVILKNKAQDEGQNNKENKLKNLKAQTEDDLSIKGDLDKTLKFSTQPAVNLNENSKITNTITSPATRVKTVLAPEYQQPQTLADKVLAEEKLQPIPSNKEKVHAEKEFLPLPSNKELRDSIGKLDVKSRQEFEEDLASQESQLEKVYGSEGVQKIKQALEEIKNSEPQQDIDNKPMKP